MLKIFTVGHYSLPRTSVAGFGGFVLGGVAGGAGGAALGVAMAASHASPELALGMAVLGGASFGFAGNYLPR